MRTMCAVAFLFLAAAILSQRAAAQGDISLPELPGAIAYVGDDFNIYSLNGANRAITALTDDAGPRSDSLIVYQWPSWSTDGRLAYFSLGLTRGGQVLETDVYISVDGRTAGKRVYAGENQVFNYAYWAPQDCVDGPGCRDLAVLLSDSAADGLIVELVRDAEAGASSRTAGSGAPFYYSWSPDGLRMLWQRDQARLDIYDVSSNAVAETLEQAPGLFSAPAWSPVDDRLLIGARAGDGQTTDLLLLAGGEARLLASELSGPVAFAWSPDGNRVAFSAGQGALFVLDAVTAETVARSPVTGVLAFFWSPDSRKIGYVTLATPPGSFNANGATGPRQAALMQNEVGLAWSLLDVQAGDNRRLTSFVPTRDMLYYLTYFDQFAQSHRLWSPDSRHLVYAEVTGDNQPVVTLLDVSGDDPVPLSVAEGSIGVWSFE